MTDRSLKAAAAAGAAQVQLANVGQPSSNQTTVHRLREAVNAASPASRWYLVQAQTGREALAIQHLGRQSFLTFMPTTWRTIRQGRKHRTIKTSFFPGYVFTHLDITQQRWRPNDSTIGVLRLVKIGHAPTPAPLGLVETMLEATDADGVLDLVGKGLKPGESVKVIRGPFADQLAVVESLDAAGRVRVLLSLMNNQIPVTFDRADLASI